MNKFFLFVALFGTIFVGRTCAQTAADYEQLGEWHNGALAAVMQADPNLNEQQKFDIIVAYAEQKTNQQLNLTLDEANAQISPYQDLEPEAAFNKLLADGKINANQLVWVKKINEIGEKQNPATFWEEITALEIQIKNSLNDTDERAVLAFSAVCRHSGKFWAEYSKGDDIGDIKCNCGRASPRSCCNPCLRRNWWRLVLADGIPALATVFGCLAATGPAAPACWVLGITLTAMASEQTVVNRCSCCRG